MNEEIADKWLKQALHDLKIAERNIEIEGYDVSAFLAQQAVEKLLKAIFVLESKRIPKIHYIDELAHKLNVSDEVMNHVFELTADYVLSRYPDVSNVPYKQYNKKIAEEKVAVFELLKDRYRGRKYHDK